MSSHTSVTAEVVPLPPPQSHLPLSSQTQTPHLGTSTQNQEKQIQDHNPNTQRHLLLEEQPLLLQDLLDQERQEQQQQKQMQALMRQRSSPESGITSMGKSCQPGTAAAILVCTGLMCVCVCVQQTLIPSLTPS